MKSFTAISAAVLIALAVPAFADSSQHTTKPDGTAGATSGTDPKGGSMSEGRSSVNDPAYDSNATNPNAMGHTTKPNGTPGETSGTDPK